MDNDILDLDEMLPEPKKVKLSGKEWKISADVPVSEILNLLKFYKKIGTEKESPEVIQKIIDILYGFFTEYQPELSKEEFSSILKISQLIPLVNYLFKGVISDEEPEGEISSKKEEAEPQKKKEEAPV